MLQNNTIALRRRIKELEEMPFSVFFLKENVGDVYVANEMVKYDDSRKQFWFEKCESGSRGRVWTRVYSNAHEIFDTCEGATHVALDLIAKRCKSLEKGTGKIVSYHQQRSELIWVQTIIGTM